MRPKRTPADKTRLRQNLAEASNRETDHDTKNATQPKSLQKAETTTAVAKMPSEKEVTAMVYEATGVRDGNLVDHIVQQLQGSVLSKTSDGFDVAIATLREMKPRTLMESQLAVEMAAVHNMAMAFINEATLMGRPYSGSDLNLARAVPLMRLYKDQLETMWKLKGKSGRQKVTVVHVNAGGQAIVGEVTTGQKSVQGGSSEKQKKLK